MSSPVKHCEFVFPRTIDIFVLRGKFDSGKIGPGSISGMSRNVWPTVYTIFARDAALMRVNSFHSDPFKAQQFTYAIYAYMYM